MIVLRLPSWGETQEPLPPTSLTLLPSSQHTSSPISHGTVEPGSTEITHLRGVSRRDRTLWRHRQNAGQLRAKRGPSRSEK